MRSSAFSTYSQNLLRLRIHSDPCRSVRGLIGHVEMFLLWFGVLAVPAWGDVRSLGT